MSAKLSTAQRKALGALLSGADQDTTAAAAGVTERTIRRWQNEPLFAAALRAGQDQAIDAAVTSLTAAMRTAVQTLSGVMTDPDASNRVRVSAANAVLANGMKLIELRDLAERIAALEERI